MLWLRCLLGIATAIPALTHAASDSIGETINASNRAIVIPVTNRNPLTQLYGLPVSPDLPGMNALMQQSRGSTQWLFSSSNFSVSSQSNLRNADSSRDEDIVFDGEFWRNDLALQLSLNTRSALSINLPYIVHHSGNSDHTIEQWHSVFGLPNGDRGLRPQDQLDYHYRANGQTVQLLKRNTQGLGDLSASWIYRLSRDTESGTTQVIRLSLKAPTGDHHRLTGSSTTDASIDWSIAIQPHARLARLGLQGSAGVLHIGNGGLLQTQRKHWVGYASGSIAYRLGANSAIKAQLDVNSAVYSSQTKELGSDAGQLALGFHFALAKQYQLDIYFTEDIFTTTSPDFGVGLALRYRPAVTH